MNYILLGSVVLSIGITQGDMFIVALGGVLVGRGAEKIKVLALVRQLQRQQKGN